MKIYGPYTLEATIYLTNGESTLSVGYQLPRTQFPTQASMAEIVKTVCAQVSENMDGDWRPCTKREYFDAITAQELGPMAPRFAMDGDEVEWDTDDEGIGRVEDFGC